MDKIWDFGMLEFNRCSEARITDKKKSNKDNYKAVIELETYVEVQKDFDGELSCAKSQDSMTFMEMYNNYNKCNKISILADYAGALLL